MPKRELLHKPGIPAPVPVRAGVLATAIAIWLVALASGALGLEIEDFSELWRWRKYDREKDYPGGSPTALGHDRDDMIYVGTQTGLLRYNGYHWATISFANYPVSEHYVPRARVVDTVGSR